MISKIQATARLCIAGAAIAALLAPAPSYAFSVKYVAANGSGGSCTAAQPCASLVDAIQALGGGGGSNQNRVICLNTPAADISNITSNTSDATVEINCPQGSMGGYSLAGTNQTLTVRGVTFFFGSGGVTLAVSGSGTVILEDCTFVDQGVQALDIEPNGPLNLVIKNSRISGNGSGVLLKPAAGGSIKATFDHVTITGNIGGGIKTDSTNGVVNLDVSNSEISNNGGNGINAVAGSNQSIVGIKNSVIARNGAAGVQANGANAGVLVATSLFDQNAAGATSVVNGGNMFSYGNNDVVGALGSGFPAAAPQY